jgi:hypothetical protein
MPRGGFLNWRSLRLLVALCSLTELARAQDPGSPAVPPAPAPAPAAPAPAAPAPAAPAPAAPAPAPPADAKEHDKLIELLITAEGLESDDDLRWLYSDSEEYAPSELVGKPIPAPALPEKGEGSSRKWDPRRRNFDLGNYILTGVGLEVGGASSLIPESKSPWRSKNRFDESVRDTIGVTDYTDGQWARDLSDVTLSVSVAYPLLVDSLIVTYWYRQSHDVAAQMALITVEALAVNSTIHGLTAGFSSRERPYARNCGTSVPGSLDDCERNKRFRSFFSGHTSVSFAAAGAACSHHVRHQVFGDPLADGIACGAALTTAGVSGVMRIVGDAHYASDVAVGAAMGTLTGIGVPWLLHYGPLARVDAANAPVVNLKLVPVSNGLGLAGQF